MKRHTTKSTSSLALLLTGLLCGAVLMAPALASAQECRDGSDNDGDGFTDLADPDCHGAFDDREKATPSPFNSFPPRLVLVFDTSGSMELNVCGGHTHSDGSLECPGSDVSCSSCCDDADGDCSTVETGSCGNGIPDDSRMFKVRQGVNDAVSAFGDVEWALMRFAQSPVNFQCDGNDFEVGGWNGGCGGGEVLVSFAPDNTPTILGWTDHTSNNGNDPAPGDDYELRSDGSTPIALSLDDAVTFLDQVIASDPAPSGCRPYEIILITDGDDTCPGNPNTAARDAFNAGYPVRVIGFAASGLQGNLNQIADFGDDGVDNDSTTAIIVQDSASLSNALATIVAGVIRVEECNGIDDDCDIAIDEGFPVAGSDEFGNPVAAQSCDNAEDGVCFATGEFECDLGTPDPFDFSCNAPNGTPNCPGNLACCQSGETECCNSVDDDCDGKVDEGLLNCNCSPVEFCNNLDDDCDGDVDEDDPLPGEGLPCGLDGIGICTAGSLECIAGELECTGGTPPGTEVCDGADNDCNGLTDELSQSCYDETFVLDVNGNLVQGCDPNDPSNCFGNCQGGIQVCQGNGFGPCNNDVGPVTETCDNTDDDCDNAIDEGFNLGQACTIGQGLCQSDGIIVCLPNGNSGCNATVIPPGPELCNDLDDDCDGDVDEVVHPPPDGLVEQNGVLGQTCALGGGVCGNGVFECVAGDIVCVGSGTNDPEICNGLDDDCDGKIDEDFPGQGDTCTTAGNECGFCTGGANDSEACVEDAHCPGGTCTPTGMPGCDQGECELGTKICVNGVVTCDGYVGPGAEICDGLDNDCDGTGDDFATCPNGNELCVEGQCAFPCEMNEFPCPFGFYCDNLPEGDFCLLDPCNDVTCDPGFVCEAGTGNCLDLCADVNCLQGEMCQDGFCVDCFDLGCPDGEICRANAMGVGSCETDLCFDVECDSGEFCRDGECVSVNCQDDCASDEVCIDGDCVPDLCAGSNCKANELCNPDNGECVTDMCTDAICGFGQACNPGTGECIPDPCVGIDCPTGTSCKVNFNGGPSCVEPPGTFVTAAGGGGCSTTGGGAGASWLLLLFGLVALRGRRRR